MLKLWEMNHRLTLDASLRVYKQMLPDLKLRHNSHSLHICRHKNLCDFFFFKKGLMFISYSNSSKTMWAIQVLQMYFKKKRRNEGGKTLTCPSIEEFPANQAKYFDWLALFDSSSSSPKFALQILWTQCIQMSVLGPH